MTVIHPPERSLPTRQELHEIQERRATKQTLAASPMQERVQITPLKITRLGPAFRNPGKHTDAVGRKVCLRIIVPVRVEGKQPGEEVETYALLDNGSDVSLCDEKLTDQLGISGV